MALFGPLMPDYADGLAAGGGDSGDVTPPTITVVSPTPGVAAGQPGGFPANTVAAAATPIVIEVTDLAPGLGYVALYVKFAGSANEICVCRRGTFRGDFVGSTVVAISNGLRFTVYRTGGWLGGRVSFAIDAVDAAGNVAA